MKHPTAEAQTAETRTPGTQTDRIEKRILLRAPRARVWRALADSQEFGSWFGATFDGPFVAGTRIGGSIQPTAVDADIAQAQEPHAGTRFEVQVERMEPQSFFSFRWHPFAVERGVDYAKEPTTLVAFELEEAEGGTLLKVTESGFDRLPAGRRTRAFSANQQGWGMVLVLIGKHLARAA